jgi:hypothetical protein
MAEHCPYTKPHTCTGVATHYCESFWLEPERWEVCTTRGPRRYVRDPEFCLAGAEAVAAARMQAWREAPATQETAKAA